MANWWLTSDGTDQWVFESLTDEEIWGLLKDYEVARRDICLIDHPTALAYAAQLPDLIIKDKEYQSERYADARNEHAYATANMVKLSRLDQR